MKELTTEDLLMIATALQITLHRIPAKDSFNIKITKVADKITAEMAKREDLPQAMYNHTVLLMPKHS